MPNQPRLSELPDFLPAAAPGTPAFDRLVFGTFSDAEANADCIRRLAQRLATTQQHTPATSPVLVKAAANER